MDWQKQNTKVYNDSAKEIAEYFKGIGSRTKDIERALKLAHKNNGAKVIELGCGDGRDATEIIKRTSKYVGIDPSIGLLDIAKENNPSESFIVSDALAYSYPTDLDVIFAFASLLHVSQNDLSLVFQKATESLRTGGIFYISLKERDKYSEEIKHDTYGDRMFYYYNPAIVRELAGKPFESVYEYHKTIGDTNWFTIALRKS